jgi:hypothetical protein
MTLPQRVASASESLARRGWRSRSSRLIPSGDPSNAAVAAPSPACEILVSKAVGKQNARDRGHELAAIVRTGAAERRQGLERRQPHRPPRAGERQQVLSFRKDRAGVG